MKSGNGQRLALKRLAVNNEQDLYLTRQEIAITKALSDCHNSVTYISSVTKQVTKDVYEVLILMELYSGKCVCVCSLASPSASHLVRGRGRSVW